MNYWLKKKEEASVGKPVWFDGRRGKVVDWKLALNGNVWEITLIVETYDGDFHEVPEGECYEEVAT